MPTTMCVGIRERYITFSRYSKDGYYKKAEKVVYSGSVYHREYIR